MVLLISTFQTKPTMLPTAMNIIIAHNTMIQKFKLSSICTEISRSVGPMIATKHKEGYKAKNKKREAESIPTSYNAATSINTYL